MQGTGDKLEPTGSATRRAGRGDAAALHPAQFLNTIINAAVQFELLPVKRTVKNIKFSRPAE